MMHVGELLQSLRLAKGITLRALASDIGIHFASLSNIEKGKGPCGEETLRRLAEELNADVDLLLGLAGHSPMPYRVMDSTTAGIPIEEMAHARTFGITQEFNPVDHYMLKVADNSMSGRGINRGDLAIVKQTDRSQPGEIAVVSLNGGKAIFRQYSRSGKKVVLTEHGKKSAVKKCEANEVEVVGILAGIVRTDFKKS